MGTAFTSRGHLSALALVCAAVGCGNPLNLKQWYGANNPPSCDDPAKPSGWISGYAPCPKDSDSDGTSIASVAQGSGTGTAAPHPKPPPLNPPSTVAGYIVGPTPLFFYGKHLYYPGDVFQHDWIVDHVSASGVTLHSRWDDSRAAMRFKRDAWKPFASK